MIKRKKRKGLLEDLTPEQHDQILENIKNMDCSESIKKVNEAIANIEKDRKESRPTDALMRIRYDAFS